MLVGDPIQWECKLERGWGVRGMNLLVNVLIQIMERLSNKPLVCSEQVTKLIENYRSHPMLLQLSSDLFYHGELQVSADREMIECLCAWDMLPNRNSCPLIFHGVRVV